MSAATGVDSLVSAARSGDRRALARLVSLVEAGGDDARAVVGAVHPFGGHALTVGITGAPGAGKSTLTNRFVAALRAEQLEVAVLAIDPSSPFSGGAILGDRVRMQDHSTDPGVFIRSMATRGHLGGLALATPQAIRVLDAAGKDVVVVETVGVGQVEVEIAGQADTTVVVVNPGWGDAVQAAKAGLMEIADVFVVNKADRAGTEDTVRDLEGMLELSPGEGWRPPVIRTVATKGDGIEDLRAAVASHAEYLRGSGGLERRRRSRSASELRSLVVDELARRAEARCAGALFDALVDDVEARRTDPYAAAARLLAP